MTLEQTPASRSSEEKGAPRPRVWDETRAGSGHSFRSIYPLRGVDRNEVSDLLPRDGNKEGAPRPRVWDETAALRAYKPRAWEISTRQGLLGRAPGVMGSLTKTVYTRARERRGDDDGPAPDMMKATPKGVAGTG
jgi:hypothetical protein